MLACLISGLYWVSSRKSRNWTDWKSRLRCIDIVVRQVRGQGVFWRFALFSGRLINRLGWWNCRLLNMLILLLVISFKFVNNQYRWPPERTIVFLGSLFSARGTFFSNENRNEFSPSITTLNEMAWTWWETKLTWWETKLTWFFNSHFHVVVEHNGLNYLIFETATSAFI